MLSLEVLCEWYGAHGAARCGDAAASRPAEAGATSPCEAQGGAAEGRVSVCVLWSAGADRRSQCSSCCAAAVRAPRSPDACAACDDAKGREPKARALRGQEGAGGRADATRADRSIDCSAPPTGVKRREGAERTTNSPTRWGVVERQISGDKVPPNQSLNPYVAGVMLW